MEILLLVVLAGLGACLWYVLRAPRPAPTRRARPRAPVVPLNTAQDEASVAGEFASPTLLYDLNLATLRDLSPPERHSIIRTLSSMPLPPRALHKLMSSTFMASASARQLTDLLMPEPMLTARIIGRANSAFYMTSRPIQSLAHALAYLGTNSVRNLALQFTMEQAFPSDDEELRAYQARLLDAGIVATELVTLLARPLAVGEVAVASTHAVLGFLGDFAMPRLMSQKSVIEHWPLGVLERTCNEQMQTGTNAGVIGQVMLEMWRLPPEVAEEIGNVNHLLVAPQEEPATARARRMALSYASCRLAEPIVLGEVANAEELAAWVETAPELHAVQLQLQQVGSSGLHQVLRVPGVQRGVERLCAGAGAATAALAV
ncbi:HDOD domain-containing protein [Thioalkalivibrio sp. XN8]|uniref:HDOD domain-containing protein n=1 Tax=Thioalkalivibrio sp. XN8 TaxID=2712863 RepID=UPI0013ECB06B|nr:HDOD domain-containing protein [Thioalkalivibrio sp. XN8]NGP52997.1 HDOD domain-containing protein [Thioalkalivibrio sp. XN8]